MQATAAALPQQEHRSRQQLLSMAWPLFCTLGCLHVFPCAPSISPHPFAPLISPHPSAPLISPHPSAPLISPHSSAPLISPCPSTALQAELSCSGGDHSVFSRQGETAIDCKCQVAAPAWVPSRGSCSLAGPSPPHAHAVHGNHQALSTLPVCVPQTPPTRPLPLHFFPLAPAPLPSSRPPFPLSPLASPAGWVLRDPGPCGGGPKG